MLLLSNACVIDHTVMCRDTYVFDSSHPLPVCPPTSNLEPSCHPPPATSPTPRHAHLLTAREGSTALSGRLPTDY